MQSQNYTDPDQFKLEALTILRTGIAQRRKLVKLGKGRLQTTTSIQQVFDLYDTFKHRWPVHGVARFIIKYQVEIRYIIPSSNPTLRQRFQEIVDRAELFQNPLNQAI